MKHGVCRRAQGICIALVLSGVGVFSPLLDNSISAQEQPAKAEGQSEAKPEEKASTKKSRAPLTKADVETKTYFGEQKDWRRLSPDDEVWFNLADKTVIVGGEVVLTNGTLEMFACPLKTKEHESIVAVKSKAFLVHTALLAVGAKPGSPVKFDPDYVAASGPIVDIFVAWEEEGKQKVVKAQEWVLNSGTKKPMEDEFIFGGSGFFTDAANGQKLYLAESGELVCLSNFSSAMLDVAVESSQSNNALMFETNTKLIPARGTKVKLIFAPRFAEEKAK